MPNAPASTSSEVGAVAFRLRDDILEVLLVRHGGEWTFPRGRVRADESPPETPSWAASRILRDECQVAGSSIGTVDGSGECRPSTAAPSVLFDVVQVSSTEGSGAAGNSAWLRMTPAAETLTHCHDRFVLAQALPIVDGCLAREGRHDQAYREFLLAEIGHATESFHKNEEDGQRRAMFFLSVAAGAGAASAFLLGKNGYKPEERQWPLIFVLTGLLLFGVQVILRLVARNLQADEFKGGLRLARRWFSPNRLDPRRTYAPFDPFGDSHFRSLPPWWPKKGGWLEVLVLANALLAGVLLAALVNTKDWPCEGAVMFVGLVATWFVLVKIARMVVCRRWGKLRDICPFGGPPVPRDRATGAHCPRPCCHVPEQKACRRRDRPRPSS